MFDLAGRVALVTGAGQNVGAGIASQLAGQGAAVAVNDLILDRAQATVAQITGANGRAAAFAFDVADWAAVLAGVKSRRPSSDRSTSWSTTPESRPEWA